MNSKISLKGDDDEIKLEDFQSNIESKNEYNIIN